MKNPIVRIDEKGEIFLKNGQMWMYQNNVANDISNIQNGAIVDILTNTNTYLGSGYFNKHSHITVRIFTKKHESIDEKFFYNKIQQAWEYRKTVEKNNLDNCRILFGEADGLPGLTVDRYNNVLVTQITCFGLEKNKEALYNSLLQVLKDENIEAIYERNDVKSREKEGLPLYKGFYVGKANTIQVINENGLLLHVDIENGQKTGYFLDQKSNRVLIRNLAQGKKVLDCFTHTGGFGLNAALGQALTVTAVDVSATALKEAKENAKINHLENIQFVQADVFAYLDTLQENAFDLIILDPPAFTKSRKTVMKAYNGYKRINMQAMQILKNGGYLATCSCSRYMENTLFEKMLKEAALEVGVTLKQISVTQQNADHPILWTMDESAYLKFYIFQIV